MNSDTDPYPDLSYLCGITAFSLPPRPVPAPRPSADHHTTDLFGPIPDHLLSRYLCCDDPSPKLHSSSYIPNSPSATTIHSSPHPLLLHSPSPCPNFAHHDSPLPPPDFTAPPSSQTLLHESLLSCDRDSPASGPRHMDSLVHQREILPPCVVNYQDSLYLTPERESSASLGVGVGDSDYLLPSDINDVALCDSNDVLAEHHTETVMKDSAFAGGYGKRLASRINRLALWRKDVILVSHFAFSDHGGNNSLQEPAEKKQKKHDVKSKGKSKGVTSSSSFYFTRSKSSANRLSESKL